MIHPYAISTLTLRLSGWVVSPCVLLLVLALGLARTLPDGGQIAFIAYRNHTIGINLLDVSRILEVQLADEVNEYYPPTWSPDGGQLAFTRYGDGKVGVYVMDAIHGATYRLSEREFEDFNPAWSPSGAEIAFLSNRASGLGVYITDSRRVNQPRLLQAGVLGDAHPAWSPDGRRLAFASKWIGTLDIYILDVESGALRQLTDDSAEDGSPVWSPAGNRIAYLSFPVNGQSRLYVTDFDTGETHWLTEAEDVLGFPISWSPDGSRIVYTAGRYGQEQLYMIDVNGGLPQRLTWNSLISRLPAWRPS